ncbi:hypothetical protein [Nocardia bovistercoris]|uniref:Uncharacterized protein n=1 Tax=Nocardia bovistercoris TaxID=2785916 RepID=A0A931IDE5_9NOCA|nr:hypothetical protein [Nocardia bovistercoris]MBH0779111.1 hypothetical protein [Nocardia bovistercoris]
MPTPECRSCRAAIDHCHGTLIVHPHNATECTDPDCTDPTHARHTFVVDCTDLAGGCPCAHPDHRAETA